MLAKRIIACLDVQNGRVVKGTRFENLKDQGDPAELAERYAAQGADEIVVLDVSATTQGRLALAKTVRTIAKRAFVPLTVGGGVQSVLDAQTLFENGADKVSVNSAALARPELVTKLADRFGRQSVVVAIDAKKIGSAWNAFTRAGTADTGRDAVAWARQAERLGAGEILLTSMDRDGTQTGFDLALLSAVTEAVRIPVVASGGAGRMSDYVQALRIADAALGAGAFHTGKIRIPKLKAFLALAKLVMRP